MRWMNTSRKQARVRGYSTRTICSARVEALESARRNSTCSLFSMSMEAVKQYESKSLHKSLSNLEPFGVRRVPWSSKIIFRREFSKYDELNYIQKVDSFLFQKPKDYIEFRKYILNIIDYRKDERLK